MKAVVSLLFVVVFITACSTPHVAKFNEQDKADLIVRYYTDDTSYVLKPVTSEGGFLSVMTQDAVVDLAKRQPGRDLAVVILIPYRTASEAGAVRDKWTGLLTGAGYQRVVFLGATGGMRVKGLPIIN